MSSARVPEELLDRHAGNVSAAARTAGIAASTSTACSGAKACAERPRGAGSLYSMRPPVDSLPSSRYSSWMARTRCSWDMGSAS